jgi:hypothetical protein
VLVVVGSTMVGGGVPPGLGVAPGLRAAVPKAAGDAG